MVKVAQGHFSAHDHAHREREDQHQRAADRQADDHHVSHLHVRDVRWQAGHEARHGEAVDVLEGIPLNLVEHVLAQVAGEAAARRSAGGAGEGAEGQGERGHHEQHGAVAEQHVHGASALDLIDEVGGEERNDTFQNHFTGDEYLSEHGGLFVLPDALGQNLDHKKPFLSDKIRMCGKQAASARLCGPELRFILFALQPLCKL